MIGFVLIARTNGDELIPAKDSVIAASDSRARLELLKEAREEERKAYLAAHPIPWFLEYGIIASERIEEVPRV